MYFVILLPDEAVVQAHGGEAYVGGFASVPLKRFPKKIPLRQEADRKHKHDRTHSLSMEHESRSKCFHTEEKSDQGILFGTP